MAKTNNSADKITLSKKTGRGWQENKKVRFRELRGGAGKARTTITGVNAEELPYFTCHSLQKDKNEKAIRAHQRRERVENEDWIEVENEDWIEMLENGIDFQRLGYDKRYFDNVMKKFNDHGFSFMEANEMLADVSDSVKEGVSYQQAVAQVVHNATNVVKE